MAIRVKGETQESESKKTGVDTEAEEYGCHECPVKVWSSAFRDAEGALRGLLPDEFWQHRRAARKEVLLAVRSLLDAAIEHVDKEPEPKKRRAATKIAVQ